MLGLLYPLLGPSNSQRVAGVRDGGHVDLGGGHTLQLLQLLPLAPEDPAVVLLRDGDLLAGLVR